jgi:hypothetical protein
MRTWIIAAILGIALSAAGASGAFAQAGSTGGTVGKQDKAVSGGGEEQGEPQGRRAKPPIHSEEKQGLPQTVHLSESSIGGGYSINLHHNGGSAYEGTWNVGIVSRMTINMTNTTMVVVRHDVSNPIGPLYSSTYSGTRAGNSASGSFVNHTNGITGTWQASW